MNPEASVVYVLQTWSEQSTWVEGVYSSLDKALEAAGKGRGKWKEQEPNGDDDPQSWARGGRLDGEFIEKREVDRL